MIFDASPSPVRPRPSRAVLIAIVTALAYPALFAAGANMPPFWLWFQSWERPQPPVFRTRLIDPPSRPEPEPSKPKHSQGQSAKKSPFAPTPAPAALRQPPVGIAEAELPAKVGASARTPALFLPPPQSAFQRERVRYEALGRESGAVPQIIIDTGFEAYAPVMRAYDAELALGLSYPAPRKNTYLYALSRGELHQGVPPRGAVPRLLPRPLAVAALKPVVLEVADLLGAAAESIQVYALYPEDLHYGLLGKVRDALARAGAAPESCAIVSFVPLSGSFDVAVRPLPRCPVRIDDDLPFPR